MATLTLLEMVQDILNDTNSDQVNSINSTPEALQVANIIKTTFFEMSATRNWPQQKRSFVLDALADSNKPTHMKLPALVKELITVRYDKRRNPADRKMVEDVTYLNPEDFLHMTNSRNETSANVDLVTDFGGIQFKIRKDVPANYWTTFDDSYIIFDSYDNTVEATMQSSNSQCLGYFNFTFTLSNSFTPSIPDEAFPLLLAKSKSKAFKILRQEVNELVEAEAQKQDTYLSRKSWRAHGGTKFPDYGRKGRGYQQKSPYFDYEN